MFGRSIGIPELLIILAIVLLIFGVGRVGRVGRELGTAIREFRKGLSEAKSEDETDEKGSATS